VSGSYFDLIDTESWPAIRGRIQIERERRIEGLLYVLDMHGLKKEQGFIEALDWVLEEAKPKPKVRERDDDDN
jgi:hypothetical protein